VSDEIQPAELARWREERRAHVLLDVREPDELAAASIDGSLDIPMRQVPARLDDLPKDRPIAVMCHHGGRSERVVAFLRAQGFENAVNVSGGIDAYALTVDASIPRY
jgi:rhodanese-related sulfurtransferase